MTARTWAWVALALTIAGSSFYIGWWLQANIKDKEIAELQTKHAKQIAAQEQARAEEQKKNRELEQKRVDDLRRLTDAHIAAIRDLQRRHAGAANRLRSALDKACAASIANAVSSDTRATSGNDAAAEGERLRARIAESITNNVIIPADEQTDRLVWCQGFVRSLKK